MRILLVSSSSGSRGGGEIFLLYLGEALRNEGHTVALWTARHPRMDELAQRFAAFGEVLRADYANTYDHWHRGLLTRRTSANALIGGWLGWRPDVIHLNKQNLEDGADLLHVAATLNVPSLATIHITQPARFLGARFAAWRDVRARQVLQAYPRPFVVVAPTRAHELKDFLGGASDVRVVLNGVPPAAANAAAMRPDLRLREALAPETFAIVAVGRLEPQKCPLRFLQHADRIRHHTPQARLRWIGSGRMADEWDRELDARQLRSTVTRIDWRNDVRSVLPAYDLFLHTAAYEGLPLALLEAMEAGLPCAVEPVVHAQLPPELQACSLVVDDRTDWRALLADRSALVNLGAHAQATVRARFSTSAMARAYEQIYRELCRKT